MPALVSLSRKIRTAHELLGVVKTMKSLAAVGIRQFERAAESLEEYRRVVDAGWLALLRRGTGPVLEPPVTGAVCLVIASDQGMCGQFNEAVFKHAVTRTPKMEQPGCPVTFWVFGEKLRDAFAETGPGRAVYFGMPGSLPAVNVQVQEVVQRIEAVRSRHGIERFYVCHNMLSEGGGYRQVCNRLLPLDREWAQAYAKKKWPGRCLPLIGLPREMMFAHLFRQYLFISLYRAFAQSLAGENAARLMAMQAAEKNIREVLDDLRKNFRELRQAAVTAELLDIISGFEALGDVHEAL
jgi:F-type H+-transporting ATPase subunit gamma